MGINLTKEICDKCCKWKMTKEAFEEGWMLCSCCFETCPGGLYFEELKEDCPYWLEQVANETP